MNKPDINVAKKNSLPKRGDSLANLAGYPQKFELPLMEDISGKYINTLYAPKDITVNWDTYKNYLSKVKPQFHPHVLFVGHDSSEIENITLMSLGGVLQHMNGTANYALVGSNTINTLDEIIKNKQHEWIGFNLYTGLTDFVFEWIKRYKIERASKILKKTILDFDTADKALKGMVEEAKGPLCDGDQIIYAPIIIGGHFNNYSFNESIVNIKTNEIIGKDIKIDFRNDIFGNSENEPRLKGNYALANKEETIIKNGIFTTCKKNKKCPPWTFKAAKLNTIKKIKL